MGIGKRIRLYRKEKGLKIQELARIIGISQGSLSDIENEKTRPSADTISSLVRNTDINPTWLLTGEGSMFREEEKSEDLPPELKKALSHPTIRSIALMLSEMPEEDIREILKRVEEKATLKKLLQKVQELERKVSSS